MSDPDGVQNLTLYYRLDPATNYTAVPMLDNGTGGDAVPGDGVLQRDHSGAGGQPGGGVLHFGHGQPGGGDAFSGDPSQ